MKIIEEHFKQIKLFPVVLNGGEQLEEKSFKVEFIFSVL